MTRKPDNPDLATNVLTLTMAGQQVMLDTLRAEIIALQTLIPGLTNPHIADTADMGTMAGDDAWFDNMPV
jgi:hypothetical protein